MPPPDETPTPDLLAALSARAVSGEAWAPRGALYAWAPAHAVVEVRARRRLLVADASTAGRPSPFNQALAGLAARNAPGTSLARRLLAHPVLRKRRYAWPAPYATVRGLSAGGYGSALIAVELRADALVLRFDPAAARRGAQPFELRDLAQRALPLAALDPARLGAIYHVRTGPAAPVAFREYVLCNEHAIARWSLATPAIVARLAEERALLAALARTPPAATDAGPRASSHWTQPLAREPGALWDQTLAVDDGRYRATPENLRALADALGAHAVAMGAAFEHSPVEGAAAFDRGIIVASRGAPDE